jgi:hypothetical protein
MKYLMVHTHSIESGRVQPRTTGEGVWRRAAGRGLLAGVAVLSLAPVAGEGMLQFPHIPPEITRIPDANDQDKINQSQAQRQNLEAINLARRKLIADESAVLLKLATDLKMEVDKTNKDTLSMNVIRKADAIEKLAHDVKERMKVSVGSN